MPSASWLQGSFRAVTGPSGRRETLCRAIRYALGLRTRLLLSSIKYRKDSISVQIDLRSKGAVIPSHQSGVPFDSSDMRMN
jgi:hypothetical protein